MSSPALPQNFAALLQARATSCPHGKAWVFIEDDVDVTYAQLHATVKRAANALRGLGVKKHSHVAIMSANSVEYCSCWLALAHLGAVMISVNARYTAPELRYVLDDGDAELLICDLASLSVVESLAEPPPKLVVFGAHDIHANWATIISDYGTDFVAQETVGLDDLLNIQYTSGTTGFPKGCMLTQRFWLHSASLTLDDFSFPLRRVIYNQNFFYMDGPFLATACLLAAGTLYIVSRPSATRFAEWVRRYEIDYCFFFEAVYKTPEAPDDAVNSLKLINTFGFNRDNHADLERRYGVVAREAFGMTECGAALRVPEAVVDKIGSGSCGVPLPTREAAVMDDTGKPVPHGQVGELWLRGPAMMLGYYNKPEASAEAFMDGWLRTGDLCRQDEEGYFYIVGRKKDMVRRNAENIACREVEEVLRSHPGVKEAAVVAVADDRVGEEVKAYVQLMAGVTSNEVSPEVILEHCEARLAVFKLPRYIEYRDAFPMTDSARVQKSKVTGASKDLRLNSYDRVDDVWR